MYYKALNRGVLELLPAYRPLILLDWGCGDALGSLTLQASGVRVLLYDPMPYVQDRIAARFSEEPDIRVLSADELASWTPQSIDAILIFSVLQYVSRDEFKKLLPRLRELLAPGGMLLLGDIVSPSLSMFTDALDLLRAGFRHGFFFDAIVGIVVTLFSDYRSVRNASGFTTYREEEMTDLLRSYGFSAERMPKNLGLSEHRILIRAIKAKV